MVLESNKMHHSSMMSYLEKSDYGDKGVLSVKNMSFSLFCGKVVIRSLLCLHDGRKWWKESFWYDLSVTVSTVLEGMISEKNLN